MITLMRHDRTMIMQGPPGTTGALLPFAQDPVTGAYRAPILGEDMKADIQFMYVNSPGASEPDVAARTEAFDSVWPAIWKLKEEHADWADQSSQIATAIVDTGLLREHPLLKPCIEDSKDFTGEGPDDLNGHGTICALITRLSSPFKLRLFNVKVATANGLGKPADLVNGIKWLIDLKRKHKLEALIANISVGAYSKRCFGLLDCRGDCEICRAALTVAREDIIVSVAAGNTPGKTACPGIAGLLKRPSGIHVVGALNYVNSGVGKYLQPGSLLGHMPLDMQICPGPYRLVKVERRGPGGYAVVFGNRTCPRCGKIVDATFFGPNVPTTAICACGWSETHTITNDDLFSLPRDEYVKIFD